MLDPTEQRQVDIDDIFYNGGVCCEVSCSSLRLAEAITRSIPTVRLFSASCPHHAPSGRLRLHMHAKAERADPARIEAKLTLVIRQLNLPSGGRAFFLGRSGETKGRGLQKWRLEVAERDNKDRRVTPAEAEAVASELAQRIEGGEWVSSSSGEAVQPIPANPADF